MMLVALLWVPLFPKETTGPAAAASGYAKSDGLFTLAFIFLMASLLSILAFRGPLWLRQLALVWISTLCCLAALEDVKGLFGYGLRGSGSDADAMARITLLPAAFWASVWLLFSVVAIALGLRSLLRAQR